MAASCDHLPPEPPWHRRSDTATGVLLQAMLALSPWTIGLWPTGSIWTLNAGGYFLGVLLLLKWVIRRATHYEPRRWNIRQPPVIDLGLGLVTLSLLAGCLVSAINARAVVDLDHLRLVENPRWIPWLPHSYDKPAAWFALWSYLGLAGVFWALRDWMTLVAPADRPAPETDPPPCRTTPTQPTQTAPRLHAPLPYRLRRLLWIICLNGGAVAFIGILLSLSHSSKLPWPLAQEAADHGAFGPFPYRNHAAQFFNIVWPLCLALWFTHPRPTATINRRLSSIIPRAAVWMLPVCLLLMIAASFVSRSRGGSIITVLLLAASLPLMLFSTQTGRRINCLAGIIALAGLALGLGLAWEPLRQRFFRDMVVYPTGMESSLGDFTIRATFRVPSTWGKEVATFAGLSDDPRLLWNTPGSMTLSLRRSGVLEARVVGTDPSRILMLTASDQQFVEAGRTLEVIFTRRAVAATLHLNGAPVRLRAPKSEAGIPWPETMASKYLWIGRGSGGSRKFNDRIEAVTLLDRALPHSVIESIADRDPQPTPIFRPFLLNDRWAELDPPPLLDVAPTALSPRQWLATGLGGRTEIHRQARAMMTNHPPLLGTGPGSFPGLFKIFRQSRDPRMDWHAHNDHLQTRITFGLIGIALVYAGLLLCPLATLSRGGVPLSRPALMLIGLSLAGALFHARFDWLFQNHGLLFLGFVICGVISACSIRNPQTQDST